MLIQGATVLYGTTLGLATTGAAFKMTLAGALAMLDHPETNPFFRPSRFRSGPVQTADGSLFATFEDFLGFFELFRIGPVPGSSGAIAGFPSGAASSGNPVQGADGNLYVATASPRDEGTVVRISLVSQPTVVIHRFSGGADGGGPTGVIVGRDGNLYGTTKKGGLGCGTVFRLTTAGAFTLLYRFRCGADGATPNADVPLLHASNGYLYGTTTGGGGGDGVVFRMQPTAAVAIPNVYAVHHVRAVAVVTDRGAVSTRREGRPLRSGADRDGCDGHELLDVERT